MDLSARETREASARNDSFVTASAASRKPGSVAFRGTVSRYRRQQAPAASRAYPADAIHHREMITNGTKRLTFRQLGRYCNGPRAPPQYSGIGLPRYGKGIEGIVRRDDQILLAAECVGLRSVGYALRKIAMPQDLAVPGVKSNQMPRTVLPRRPVSLPC